ncbi:enoyl-CoA hydratase-related protein [Melioribacteraceae bacterium 4301-Me]|uniref:enoyl-CoA hydratase-related protein n=1 Tax=Pyranulibacter aquaticus TaxID=3163344 RepID=UPI0035998C7B
MSYKLITVEIKENVSVIKLNRPEVLNSINKHMAKEIQDALIEAKGSKEIRAVLLTGEGRAFCAGQDLAEAVPLEGNPADIGEIIRDSYNPIIKLIRETEKPIVCAVNGVAAGAGVNITLACDIVLASDSASFIQAFSKIGLIPDSGGTFFLPRIAGVQRASAMTMLADKITAAEALNFGLVYKIFPDDKLFDEAFLIAKKLSQMPTKALGLIKRALNKSLTNNLEEQLALEEKLQIEASKTDDYKEGVKAFLEKRTPKFKGE